jgi:hypothetical protein
MDDGKNNSPPVLHVIMATGEELDFPIDLSRLSHREFGECKLTELLGGTSQDEISITVRITYDEIGVWVAEQCRHLLRLPEDTDISYDIDPVSDFVVRVRPSSGSTKEISVNLYHTLSEDIHSLVRYVGGWGKLLDAGFEILDASCINFNDSDRYVDLTLFGPVHKLSAD